MKVKTYKTESLEEGLENIKRDLGHEALILSTRSVKVRPPYGLFKKASWEITAALDDREEVKPASKAVAAAYDGRESEPEREPAVIDRRASLAAAAVDIAAVQKRQQALVQSFAAQD